MINAKIILASAALFAAPASAQAMEPVDAMAHLIKIAVAHQYCGVKVGEKVILKYVKVVQPLLKVDDITFVQSVADAAYQQGQVYAQNGSLPGFCANVGAIYGRYGK
jgi:hypothetical protein